MVVHTTLCTTWPRTTTLKIPQFFREGIRVPLNWHMISLLEIQLWLYFQNNMTMSLIYDNYLFWSCKVSKGVMQEQEFLISHPCETQDSREKWSLKSLEKYHCKTMQDLAPAKSNRTKGGAMTLKNWGRASLLGYRRFLQEQHPFSSTYWQYVPLYIYGLAFLVRPGLQDKTQVLREKSHTRLARSRSKTKL